MIGLLLRKTNNFAFLRSIGKKNKDKKVKETVQVNEDVSDDVPDEIKAAIIAAIMAYYSRESQKCEFKVKRINRIKE